MRFRKPELIPLLFILCATLVLSGLGAWQLKRLSWKESLLSAIAAAQSQPTLTSLPPSIDTFAYRNVSLWGRYHNEHVIRMVGRKQGMRAGFFIVTPFELENGQVILVNRGYAEEGKENPLSGKQHVEGILRPAREQRPFAPANQPENNLWFYEDIPIITQKTGLKLLPMVIEATGKGESPVPSDGKITLRNDHLGYAITWFSLALVGLIMFGFYYRIPEKKGDHAAKH